jgi:hypothetical protein
MDRSHGSAGDNRIHDDYVGIFGPTGDEVEGLSGARFGRHAKVC